jgi:CRP/FNR family cyclic AMP-dependent transcriptional regulator
MTANDLSHTDHPFLKELSDSHMQAIAEFAMPVRVSANESIFKQGDMADRFYLIHDGRVSLRAAEAAGKWTEIQELRSGDVLGWSWLFEPYEWQYDAVALEETTATFFYGTWLREKCEAEPALGVEIMKRIAQVVIARLQATRQKVRALSSVMNS